MYLRRVTSAVILSLLAMFLTSTTAAAIPPGNGRCDANEICLYEHTRFGGGIADFRCNVNWCEYETFRHWTFSNGHRISDAVSSMKNTSTKCAEMFYNEPPDPGQQSVTLWKGDEWAVLGWDMNDAFSSMWIGTC